MKQYYEFHSLEHIYLEDSWVLDIQTEPDSVEISVETVLTANHPQYSDPHWRVGRIRDCLKRTAV